MVVLHRSRDPFTADRVCCYPNRTTVEARMTNEDKGGRVGAEENRVRAAALNKSSEGGTGGAEDVVSPPILYSRNERQGHGHLSRGATRKNDIVSRVERRIHRYASHLVDEVALQPQARRLECLPVERIGMVVETRVVLIRCDVDQLI